jgi:hypothetical protein
MLTSGVVLRHTAARTRALLEHFDLELFDHPPYSCDLAPRDCHLFTSMKNWLGSQRLNNNELMEGDKTWLSSHAAYRNVFPDTSASISAVIRLKSSLYVRIFCI